MQISKVLQALVIASCAIAGTAIAAPLPEDVPESHWAKDAVNTLVERGFVQGYSDNTFKGDRALTRWELATIVAKMMAQTESKASNFATKEELAALQRLAESLRPELEALGVRLTSLEGKVQELDKRVSELERITFYGSMQTVVGGQCFYNTSPGYVNTNLLDFEHMIGTASSAGGIIESGPATGMPMNAFVFGGMPVVNLGSGRAMTNGFSCSSTLRLGTNFLLTDDIHGGAEFAAYSSIGDRAVDAYWGASAPYSCDVFTATAAGDVGAGNNHSPYTRMVLDNFWLEHKPTKTKIVGGAFKDTNFDSFIYIPQINPNANGRKYVDNYGLKATGEIPFGEGDKANRLIWEAVGMRLADGNVNTLIDKGYFSHSEGVNLTFMFNEDRGRLRGNFLHTANESSDGGVAASGLIMSANSTINWVNPNGFYLAQLGMNADTAGIGSGTDVRPIPMVGAVGNDGIVGIPGVPNLGGIGPQDMNAYGFSARYQFDDVLARPEVFAEYGHTEYTPNKRSNYSVDGDMWRAGINMGFGKDILKNDIVNVNLSYKSVDPTYDPFILALPQVDNIASVLWRVPGFTYINSLYSLQDTETYIHNRQGFDTEVNWRFLPTGKLNLSYSKYQQVKTSMQDVRYSANSLGMMTPNTDVLGFSPGFIDAVFHGYSKYTFASDGVNEYADPLEDPRGTVEKWGASIGLKYVFDPKVSTRGITFGGGARNCHFLRKSNLSQILPGEAGLRGENQNNVDLHMGGWKVFVDYEPTEKWKIGLSVNDITIAGHYDPLGVMGNQAVATGDTKARMVYMTQIYPEITADYEINDSWDVGMMGRYYWSVDHLPENNTLYPAIPSMNIEYGPVVGSHSASWEGWQLYTYCNFKF